MDALAVWAAALVIGLTLLLAPVVRWVLKWWRTRQWLRTTTIPGPAVPNAVLGHAGLFLGDRVFEVMSGWANEYGPIFRLQMLNNPGVVVTGTEAIYRLLRKGPDYVPKNPAVYDILELGSFPRVHNIVSSQDDPYWKAVRTGLAPCFSISNLKKVFPHVQRLTREAVAVVGTAAAAGKEVDVADLAMRVTSDVMGGMLLDQDFGGMKMRPDPYLTIFRDVLTEAHANLTNPLRKYAFWDANARRGWRVMRAHDQKLQEKLGDALRSPPGDHTIAGHLFKVKDPATGQRLQLPSLKAELGIVMGAGFETTSHAITWTLALLATHPAIQDKLATELLEAGLGDGEFDWGHLGRLPYLNAVAKEGLRLFSPAFMGTSRIAGRDMEICGHKVPKGTWVMIQMGPIGTSTYNYGPTACLCDPERWMKGGGSCAGPDSLAEGAAGSPDDATSTEVAAAGAGGSVPDPLTFSTGPRDCVGQTLAKMELQVVVASLISKFKFTPGTSLARAVAAAKAAAKSRVGVDAGDDTMERDQDQDQDQDQRQHVDGLTREQQELAAVLRGVYQTAIYHVTLQPKDGMLLVATPRECASDAESAERSVVSYV